MPSPQSESIADGARSNESASGRSAIGRYWPLLVLLLLTIAGGAVRFFRLSQPCLWGDEALVYYRICGTYAQMLGPLKNDGFGPLHYEANWLIAQFFKPTPIVLRMIPAVCGTLMIPAMYFLARQMLPRTTSLVAAAFTAFSGFLIVYSRDAKMYMDAWLFVTLNVACLLWWFRTGRWTAWLCWIACGCLAGGIHASSLVVIALSPLLLLTQCKLHWKTTLLWLAGVVIILSGPVIYYTQFNQFISNVEERGWQSTGIAWVDFYTHGRDGPEMVQFNGTFYLMGWLYPHADDDTLIPPGIESASILCIDIILILLVVGALPWPLRWIRRAKSDPPPEPQWRVFFWLATWIVLPTYVFYCHSIEEFFSPMDWIRVLTNHLQVSIGIAIAAVAISIVAAAVFPGIRGAFVRGVQLILAIVVVFLLCLGVFKICTSLALNAMLSGQRWHSIWVPRYAGFTWPAIGLAVAALLMRLPTRPVRMASILFLLTINLIYGSSRFMLQTEPPLDQMAADAHAAQNPDGHTRTYTGVHGGRGGPGDGTIGGETGDYYIQQIEWRQPMSPDEYKRYDIDLHYRFWHGYSAPTIAADVRANPQLNHIILWSGYRPEIPDAVDRLGPMLHGWKLVSEKWYPHIDYWAGYQYHGSLRRREYVRNP